MRLILALAFFAIVGGAEAFQKLMRSPVHPQRPDISMKAAFNKANEFLKGAGLEPLPTSEAKAMLIRAGDELIAVISLDLERGDVLQMAWCIQSGPASQADGITKQAALRKANGYIRGAGLGKLDPAKTRSFRPRSSGLWEFSDARVTVEVFTSSGRLRCLADYPLMRRRSRTAPRKRIGEAAAKAKIARLSKLLALPPSAVVGRPKLGKVLTNETPSSTCLGYTAMISAGGRDLAVVSVDVENGSLLDMGLLQGN